MLALFSLFKKIMKDLTIGLWQICLSMKSRTRADSNWRQ